jgi:hypothetical protein
MQRFARKVQNNIPFSKLNFVDTSLIKNRFNMLYIDHYTDSPKYHRSGWNFVQKNLELLHDENADLIFDTYVDATFLWKFDDVKHLLPYPTNWIGVIHHTENEEYSQNNAAEIFKNKVFIDSLKNCKCLIVLSWELHKYVKHMVKNLNLNTLVHCLVHPTLFVEKTFSSIKFRKNTEKSFMQIGGWMRDTYAIYKLYVLPKFAQKIVLRQDNMNGYFKPNDMKINIESKDTIATICGSEPIDISKNKYITGLLESIEYNYSTVETRINVDDDAYDELLTKNIVFLYLYDASACNTLIECIVRRTPILVNKIAPIIEFLGQKYPLFYDTIEEASILAYRLCDSADPLLDTTVLYLNKLDKSSYQIGTFMKQIGKIIA